MSSKKTDLPTSMSDLAVVASNEARTMTRLFRSTELANIPHTPENIRHAVSEIRYISDQTQVMLNMSSVQRGMRLCWLKANYTQHGQWQEFCEEHFPEISNRSIQRWMAAYLTAVGEKKPRALPKYDEADLEDAELAEAIESLSTDKADLAPRKALMDHISKQEKSIEKGQKQLSERDETIADLQARLESLQAESEKDFLPAGAVDEADKLLAIRGEFAGLFIKWANVLPDDLDLLRQHKEMLNGLPELCEAFYHDHIEPRARELTGR